MGRDLWEPREPTYVKGYIQWGVRNADPNTIFEVHGTSFVLCFPVENDRVFDREHIAHVAREHWDALEEIAIVAVKDGQIEKEVRHRGVNWRTVRIKASAFSDYAKERGYRS